MMDEEDNKAAANVPEEEAVGDSGVTNNSSVTLPGGIAVNEQLVPVLGVFLGAAILFVSFLIDGNNTENFGYGIALTTIAMFFSLVRTAITVQFTGVDDQMTRTGLFIGYFIFVWCFIGTCIVTFDGPYKFTGNGYFAAWAMSIFATQGAGIRLQDVAGAVAGMGSLLGFWVSSLVVLVAVCVWDSFKGAHSENLIYSLVLACTTLLVVGYFYFMKDVSGTPTTFYVMAAFSIMWIVQASLVTFDGPFKSTGNGYFGSWAAAITSIFAAMAARRAGMPQQQEG